MRTTSLSLFQEGAIVGCCPRRSIVGKVRNNMNSDSDGPPNIFFPKSSQVTRARPEQKLISFAHPVYFPSAMCVSADQGRTLI